MVLRAFRVVSSASQLMTGGFAIAARQALDPEIRVQLISGTTKKESSVLNNPS